MRTDSSFDQSQCTMHRNTYKFRLTRAMRSGQIIQLQARSLVIVRSLIFAFALSGVASIASADVITLNAIDTGRYTDSGFHDPADTNINIQTFLGSVSGNEWRNWFVFDLSGVTGTIQSATLSLETAVIFREVEFLD